MNRFHVLILLVLLPGRMFAETDASVLADLEHLKTIAEPDEVDLGIAKGLEWLVSQQDPETGAFKGKLPTTYTALSCMALMASGHLPGRSEYGEHVRKGVLFLVEVANEKKGYFGHEKQGRMYAHGICSLALSEAYGMMETEEENRKVKEALELANRVTFDAQVLNEKAKQHFGGWRYEPRPKDADLSVTVWLVLALRSAQNAQLEVPQEVIDNALTYVRNTWEPKKKSYSYMPRNNQSMSMRCAGVVCMLAMGDNQSPELRKRHEQSLEVLNDFDPRKGGSHYFYQCYYVATAANMIGEETREAVLPKMEEALLRLQEENGSFKNNKGFDGGVYSTAFSLLTLAVRYQVLPIYQE